MLDTKDETSFKVSLRIQLRIIAALMRRDFIALNGRAGLGFLIIFLEPLVIMGVIMVVVSILRSKNALLGFPVVAFVFGGWGHLWACRYPLQRITVVTANPSHLLYHKNIKLIDIILSRTLVLSAGAFSSYFVLFIVYNLIEPSQPIYDVSYCLISVLLLVWYTLVLCLLIGILAAYFKACGRVGTIIAAIHIALMGSLFMVDWIPPGKRYLALLIPTVNLTEMMRYGLFGDTVTCYFSISYTIYCLLSLTFASLVIIRILTRTRDLHAAIR